MDRVYLLLFSKWLLKASSVCPTLSLDCPEGWKPQSKKASFSLSNHSKPQLFRPVDPRQLLGWTLKQRRDRTECQRNRWGAPHCGSETSWTHIGLKYLSRI